MTECNHYGVLHTDQDGNQCCLKCGEKLYRVETRECGDCLHHHEVLGGGICRKHLMACWRGMHVTYKINQGTCFEPDPGQS